MEAPAPPQRALHFLGPMIRPHVGTECEVSLLSILELLVMNNTAPARSLAFCTALHSSHQSTDRKHVTEVPRASLFLKGSDFQGSYDRELKRYHSQA